MTSASQMTSSSMYDNESATAPAPNSEYNMPNPSDSLPGPKDANLCLFDPSPEFIPKISSLDTFTRFHSPSDTSDQQTPPPLGTYELGDNGYSAVLSTEFDLLQLTAPSGLNVGCGIIFARGSFPDSPGSILSRGQRSGFGFGLRIPDAPEYRLTEYLPENPSKSEVRVRDETATGWLNYRWPVTREVLQGSDDQGEAIAEVISAWCVKYGSFIQVSRIARVQGNTNNVAKTIRYKFGDRVRLGCCCTACPSPIADSIVPPFRRYHHESKIEKDGHLLTVEDADLGAKLYVQWFQDGKRMEVPSRGERGRGNVNIGLDSSIDLKDTPIIIVHITSLRARGSDPVWFECPPLLTDIERYLEIGPSCTKYALLWKASVCQGAEGYLAGRHYPDTPQKQTHQLKLDVIGRTMEHLLSVSTLPVQSVKGSDQRKPIALLSDVVYTMRVDIQTLFWQVRTLIRTYNSLKEIRNDASLGPLCSSYRLRIKEVLIGVTSWIYFAARYAEKFGQKIGLEDRWFFVTGIPGVINRSCERAASQFRYLRHSADFSGYRDNPLPHLNGVLQSAGYTHWLLYWHLTLLYTFQNAGIPELNDLILRKHKSRQKLTTRHSVDLLYGTVDIRRKHSAESMLHAYLTWFYALFSALIFPSTEKSREEEKLARDELKRAWEAERTHRTNPNRQSDSYRCVDELNDRMALVIGELGFRDSEQLAKSLVKDVQQFMEQRQRTEQINSPKPTDFKITSPFVTTRIRRDIRQTEGEENYWSPWEATCLNHLINLRSHYNTLCGCTRIRQQMICISRMNVIFEDCLKPFIQRGLSIVPSWDETLGSTLYNWWSTETASIFVATLLDELQLTAKYISNAQPKPKSLFGKIIERSSDNLSSWTGGDSDDDSDLDTEQTSEDLEIQNLSYPNIFLCDRILGDEIRILLHETMMRQISDMEQHAIIEAMIELEEKACLLFHEHPELVQDCPVGGDSSDFGSPSSTVASEFPRKHSRHYSKPLLSSAGSPDDEHTQQLQMESGAVRRYSEVQIEYSEIYRKSDHLGSFPNLFRLLKREKTNLTYPNSSGTAILRWDGLLMTVETIQPSSSRLASWQERRRVTVESPDPDVSLSDLMQEALTPSYQASLPDSYRAPQPKNSEYPSVPYSNNSDNQYYQISQENSSKSLRQKCKNGLEEVKTDSTQNAVQINPITLENEFENVLLAASVPLPDSPSLEHTTGFKNTVDDKDEQTSLLQTPPWITHLIDVETSNNHTKASEAEETSVAPDIQRPATNSPLPLPTPTTANPRTNPLGTKVSRKVTYQVVDKDVISIELQNGAQIVESEDDYQPRNTLRSAMRSNSWNSHQSRDLSPLSGISRNNSSRPASHRNSASRPYHGSTYESDGSLDHIGQYTSRNHKFYNQERFWRNEYPFDRDIPLPPRTTPSGSRASSRFGRRQRNSYNPRRVRIARSESDYSDYDDEYYVSLATSYLPPRNRRFNHNSMSDKKSEVSIDRDKRSVLVGDVTGADSVVAVWSESGYDTMDPNDFGDIFEIASTIFHPHYMITSIEDTPALFSIRFEDRAADCEVENIKSFLKASRPPRLDDPAAPQVKNWDYCRALLKGQSGLTIVDLSSQYRLSVYNEKAGLVLARHIFDNRVDTDAKYRIIAIDAFTHNIAELHICVLHIEALSGLDNYLCGFSNVLNRESRKQWDTFLTLAFHDLQDPSEPVEVHRTRTAFPPPTLALTGQEKSSILIESAMSFAITGHRNGRTWTCSILGRRLANYVKIKQPIEPRDLEPNVYPEELRQLVETFGHDGRAARCLVAQTMVGFMFAEIAKSYTELLETLENISAKSVIFDTNPTSSDKEGETVDLHSFQEIFTFNWAIECLRKFEETIDNAKTKGEEAKRMLDRVLDETKHYWSPEMRQIREKVVQLQYERRLTQLENTHQKISRREKKLTADRDGILNLLALRNAIESANQSAAAVEQGSNIQILTLITITYLPLSLATSAFGMGIMPKSVDFRAFAVILAAASILTVLSVLNLATMTRNAKILVNRLRTFGKAVRCQIQGQKYPNRGHVFGHPGHQAPPDVLPEQLKDASSVDSPQSMDNSQNHWWNFLFIIRYFLTTYPLLETSTTLDLVTSWFRQKKTNTNGDSSLQTSKTFRFPPVPPSRLPPAQRLRTPPEAQNTWESRFTEHISNCPNCSLPNIQANQANFKRCGVGSSLLKTHLESHDGLRDHELFSDPPDPVDVNVVPEAVPIAHSPRSRRPRPTGLDGISKLLSANNRVDSANSTDKAMHFGLGHLSLSRRHTMQSGVKMRKWIPVVGNAIIRTVRVLLLPIWMSILLVDYVVIFVALGVLTPFADLGFDDDDMEWKRMSWLLVVMKVLERPMIVITRGMPAKDTEPRPKYSATEVIRIGVQNGGLGWVRPVRAV